MLGKLGRLADNKFLAVLHCKGKSLEHYFSLRALIALAISSNYAGKGIPIGAPSGQKKAAFSP